MHVVISCLAELKPREIEFFRTFMVETQAQGVRPIFLSPHTYDDLGCETLWLPPRWDEWGKIHNLGELPIQEALTLLDVQTWLRRVEFFWGDPLGRRDCSRVLGIMAGFSLALLRQLRAVAFISWNPPDPTTGIMHELARKLGVATFALERGVLPDTFNCDFARMGIYESLSDKNWDELGIGKQSEWFEELGNDYANCLIGKEVGRYSQARPDVLQSLEISSNSALRPRVLVLGNFDMACGISPGDPLKKLVFPGFNSGFELAKAVAANHGGLTIYKPHPAMQKRLRYLDVRGVSNLVVGTGEPGSYLRWADVIVSYGSSLDFHALAMGKSLVLCGRSLLFNKGIAYQALSEDELNSSIQLAVERHDIDSKLSRFRQFVGCLLEWHLVRIDDAEKLNVGVASWVRSMDISSFRLKTWSNEPDIGIDSLRRSGIPTPSAVSKLFRRAMRLGRSVLIKGHQFICRKIFKCN